MAKRVSLKYKVANKWTWLALPPLLFLVLFFVTPLWRIVERSVTDPTFGIGNYAEFFRSSVYLEVLWNTLFVSSTVTAICLLLSYPYAYLMNQVSARLAGLMLLAALIPLWSSLLARTYAWLVILQDSGLLNSLLLNVGIINEPLPLVRNFLGVIIGMVQILLPFMLLPIYAVMRRLDPDHMRAAANLGSTPFQAFWRVFFPLSLPGVYAGALLVFVVALGFYVTPAVLGGPKQEMLGEVVVRETQALRNWGMGSAIGMVLLSVTMLVLVVVSRVVRIGDALSGGRET
jgi:putative spermidine/putrescine transport system permease protein